MKQEIKKIYILTQEDENGTSIINCYLKKDNAINEMKHLSNQARSELNCEGDDKEEDDGKYKIVNENEIIITETEDSFYISNETGRYFFFEVKEAYLQDDRYSLRYDGTDNDEFKTYSLKAAINAAMADYENGEYSKIEIYDNVREEIVWSTNSDFDDLKDYLDEWAEGKDVSEVDEYLKEKGAKCYDTDIDDGIDEGEYLMYKAYDFGENTIKIYYSSVTYKVTDIAYR